MSLIRALLVTQIMRFEAADSTECGDRAESLAHTGFAAGIPGAHRTCIGLLYDRPVVRAVRFV